MKKETWYKVIPVVALLILSILVFLMYNKKDAQPKEQEKPPVQELEDVLSGGHQPEMVKIPYQAPENQQAVNRNFSTALPVKVPAVGANGKPKGVSRGNYRMGVSVTIKQIDPNASKRSMTGNGNPSATLTSTSPSVPANKDGIRTMEPLENVFYAPYGRWIRCVLVNTLESSNEASPIVGRVVEDFVWNGQLIFPSGTEVHGIQAVDERFRNRIGALPEWKCVFQPSSLYPQGGSYRLNAKVLDRDENLSYTGEMEFGQTQGSYGLRGVVIENADSAYTKAFFASFLQNAATALQDRTNVGTTGMTTYDTTTKNALLSGASGSLDRLIDRIEAEIELNGYYTLVQWGTEFFLYVEQDINVNPDMVTREAEAGGVGNFNPANVVEELDQAGLLGQNAGNAADYSQLLKMANQYARSGSIDSENQNRIKEQLKNLKQQVNRK